MVGCNRNNRLGIAKRELVAAGFCIAVLCTLIVPSILESRKRQRGNQCLNNVRNVSVAIHNFASSNKSRLLAQAYYPGKITSDGSSWEMYEGRSWVTELLPYLKCDDSYDRWNISEPWNSEFEKTPGRGSNSSIGDRYRPTLACPNDDSSFQRNGGLSYVVNCGIGDANWMTITGVRKAGRIASGQHPMVEPFDWNGDGVLPPDDLEDAFVTRDFTLFWPSFRGQAGMPVDLQPMTRHSLSEIYDGTSNTIMLGENTNAGSRPGSQNPSWADPQVCSNGMVLPIDAKRVSASAMADDNSLAGLVLHEPFSPAINASLEAGEGVAPFLNSRHNGCVVVSFVDGSVTTLSEDIDMSVYVRLLTPCGTRIRNIPEFVPEAPISNSDEF